MVLVIHNNATILAWLTGATFASAAEHISNGYPELQADWDGGKLIAVEVDVPKESEYSLELYQVVDGQVMLV